MLDDLQHGVVQKFMNDFDEKLIIDWIGRLSIDSGDESVLYKTAHNAGKVNVIATLMEKEHVARIFHFVDDYKDQWLKSGELDKLEFPLFNTRNMTFKLVVCALLGDQFNNQNFKRMAGLVKEYGIRPMNNYQTLRRMFMHKNVCLKEFFRIDHSIVVPKLGVNSSIYLDPILVRYPIARIVKLLLSTNKIELRTMTTDLVNLGRNGRTELLNQLPRKPKRMEEIHKVITEEISRMYPPDRVLAQSISRYHQRTVYRFEIWIPEVVADLRNMAFELENCLDQYVTSVLAKETQIMILKESGIPKYAIRVERQDGKLVIGTILGKKNAFVPEAGKIRNELYKIFDEV
ncbi:MAG: hypothetical protein V4598_05635 [Bdellovibrionota bacterium]